MQLRLDSGLYRGLLLCSLILILATHAYSQSYFQAGFHIPGVDGRLHAVEAGVGTELCVGGNFSVITGLDEAAEDFAMYDLEARTWSGLGFDSVTSATFRFLWDLDRYNGNDIIVAGRFEGIGSSSIKNIARYDGSAWQPLTPGDTATNEEIRAVEVVNEVIYVAGDFTEIGGVEARRVARWDPTNGWQALGGGLGYSTGTGDEQVNALAYHEGRLYAAGFFRQPGNVDFDRFESLAVWDGSGWEYLGNGISYPDQVFDILVEADTLTGGDRVFIAGAFRWVNGISSETDTITSKGVAAYHTIDSTWEAYDTRFEASSEVYTIARINEQLVIGGNWLQDFGGVSSRLAVWLEPVSSWVSWGYGAPDGRVHDIRSGYGDRVYVAGDFSRIGAIDGLVAGEPKYVSGLAYRRSDFSDSTWYSIGEGTAPDAGGRGVFAFALQIDEATNDTTIIVGGGFDAIGGQLARGLAFYTDTGWYVLPDFPRGSNPTIKSIDVNGDSILVFGSDLWTGLNDPREQLALWDGTSWIAVGGGPGLTVHEAIIDFNGDIVVGGSFDNGTDWSLLKRWNGGQWIEFLDFSNSGGVITAFERHPTDDTIFVAGSFRSRVGILGDSSVTPLGDGFNPWLESSWRGNVLSLLPTEYGIYFGIDDQAPGNLRFWRYGGGWSIFEDTTFGLCYRSITAMENTIGCEILIGGNENFAYLCDSFPGLATYESGFAGAGGVFGLGREVADMLRVGDELWIGGVFDNIDGIPSSDLAVMTVGTDTSDISRLQFTGVPAEDTVLNWGEVFHIDWTFSDGVPKPVLLEVSLDSGLTWTEMSSFRAREFGRWWIVPETTAAFCQIRLSDRNLPCVSVTSDLFSIQNDPGLHVDRLSRGGAEDPHPVPYVPAHDDWSFDNMRYFMWPEVAWQDFDYSDFLIEADRDIFPSWERYCDAFGRDWCYTDEVAGIGVKEFVNPAAYTDWRLFARDWNGSCFGFALTALRVFAGLNISFLLNPEAPHLDSTWLALTEYNTENDSLRQILASVRNTLNRWFCYQFTPGHAVIVAGRSGLLNIDTPIGDLGDDPMETLQTIRNDWNAPVGAFNARVLALWDWDNLSRAHAVLPYKIVNHEDSAHIYQLYVYDSNENGGDTLHIRIDSIANTWEYDYETLQRDDDGNVTDTIDRGWDPRHEGLFVLKEVTAYGNTAVGKNRGVRMAGQRNDTTALFAMARVSPTYDIIFVSDSGDTTGYLDGNVIWQADNTAPVYPLNSLYEGRYPLSYLMPDSARSVTISNALDTTIQFGWSTDSSAYAYERFDADPAAIDGLKIDTALTAFNPDAAEKIIQIDAATRDSVSGKLIRVAGISMAQDDSLALAIASDGQVTVDNAGSGKTVELLLWGSDRGIGDQYVQAIDVVLNGDARYTLPINWAVLDGPQEMQVDRGRDGSVDETMPLNVVVGISDDDESVELPGNFSLSQNYPNPFNPSTRIDFAVPTEDEVTLVVYNVLGKQVKTLIDRTLAAGAYSVAWDGTTDAGKAVSTGVYFYRLSTSEATSSKKMLLLK
ncbi:T9SS type A sorting domain-containing protein [candidate division GN15 bacterium]|nr:T9SS type A sorting domain-containing protein [candidate division GN15 bacterium]